MKNYRTRFYQSYVSSGQAMLGNADAIKLNTGNLAYFRRVIQDHLPADRTANIVDLACGHGGLITCLKELGYVNVKGFDLSPEQVALAHRLGLADVQLKDMKEALKDGSQIFDVVFLMDILEHLSKDELLEVLDLLRTALKDNGLVVIHVPNAEGLHGMRIRYGDLTHELCFTRDSIRQVLQVCGFSDIRCFEDKPVVRGLKSFMRRVLWEGLTLHVRLRLLAETGAYGHILSQNLLVTARR